jgi:hypothetical protein
MRTLMRSKRRQLWALWAAPFMKEENDAESVGDLEGTFYRFGATP